MVYPGAAQNADNSVKEIKDKIESMGYDDVITQYTTF
jgi:hypothetical protein